MKKTLLLLVVLLVSVMLLVSACGKPVESETADPASSGETPAPVADGERPLRIGVSGDALADPAMGSYNSCLQSYINLYDSLVMYNVEGELVPLLASSWEPSEDGLTYTLKLNEGWTFHDGSEVLASDVVFSLNRLLTIGAGLSFVFEGFVDSAEALDDYTVAFHLPAPDAVFIDRLSRLYIVNEDLIMANLSMDNPTYSYGEFGDYGISYLVANDAGSGPYALTEFVAGNYMRADMYEDYALGWGENAPTYIKFINNCEPSTVRTMLANKELEISDNWQNAETYAAWSSMDGISITQYSSGATVMVPFNCFRAPTDDVNVRRAIACLIDYASLVESIYPGSQVSYGPVNTAVPGADASVTELAYNYDLERAKAYLAASKYADQLDSVVVEFFCGADSASQEKIGLTVQAAASQIGLNVKVTTAPYSTLLELVGSAETTPNIIVNSLCPLYWDASDMFVAHYAAAQGTIMNTCWIEDSAFVDQVYASLKIADPVDRYAAYAEISSYITDQCFSMFAGDLVEKVAYQSDYVYWPTAAEYFDKDGTVNVNELGYQYWAHDFEIYADKM